MNESEVNDDVRATISAHTDIDDKDVHVVFCECVDALRSVGSLNLTVNLKKKLIRTDLLATTPAAVFGMIPKLIVNDHNCIAPVCSIVCVGAVKFVPNRLFPATLPWMTGGRVAVLLKSWYTNDASVIVMMQDSRDPRGQFSGAIEEWPIESVCHVENHVMIKRTAHCFNGFKWENPSFPVIKVVSWSAARRGVPDVDDETDAVQSLNNETQFKTFCRNLEPAFGRLDVFTFSTEAFTTRLTDTQAAQHRVIPGHVNKFEWLLCDIILDTTLRKPYLLFLTNPHQCLRKQGSVDFLAYLNANLVHLQTPEFEQELFALGLTGVDPTTEGEYDEFQKLLMLAVMVFPEIKFYFISPHRTRSDFQTKLMQTPTWV